MALTAIAVKNFKAESAQYKRTDEKGLYLLIMPTGGKYWHFKYQFNKKTKYLALGVYPQVDLKSAREKRDEYRRLVAQGIDPKNARQLIIDQAEAEQENCFGSVASEWIKIKLSEFDPTHCKKVVQRLERDILPYVAETPIKSITPPELLKVIRRIEERGSIETAHRALQSCGQIFRYGIATGRCDTDITAHLKGALRKPEAKHFAAIIDPKQFGGLIRSINTYQGNFKTKCALRLAPLVFLRPGELRHAQWDEIDFENALWSISAKKMKMKEDFLVPLSKQALEIFAELKPLTGKEKYVFPSERTGDRPMSDNTVLSALRRMGYGKDEMTGHGFRAAARTIMEEQLNVPAIYLEPQLAHAVRDTNGRAYNRTTHLPARRAMMQQWADYLDVLAAKSPTFNLSIVKAA